MAVETLEAARVPSRPDDRPHSTRAPVAVVVGLAALAVIARFGGVASGAVAGAELAFVSLVAESLPFLLAGALLSVAACRVVESRVMARLAARPRLLAALAPLTGAGLPLCDCGLLPLARRLRDAGGERAVGSFLAGAPLTNPIVVVSTLLAFPGRPGVTVARVACGLAVAMAVAALVSAPAACPTHDHGDHSPEQRPSALAAVATELARTGPVLVVGAAAAATLKAAIPTSALTSVTSQPLLGAAAMIVLAFVMSLCSQADAFVAAALPVGMLPRLAFLVVGPALDLRLAVLYRQAFGGRWLAGYAAVVLPAALVACTVCAVVGLV